jgi:TrkA domain protein
MHIYRTMVPGSGVLHQIVTRDGERCCLLVDAACNRHLFTYDGSELDEPTRAIVREPDEADEVASRWPRFLHRAHATAADRPIADRLLARQRRVNELIGERGR